MIGKTGSGWQTTTADLALILFLVVSAASTPAGGAVRSAPGKVTPPASSQPIAAIPSSAVYRATEGTSLSQWLAAQASDDRQVVTVVVKRAAKGPSPAMRQGIAFLDQIQESGRPGRLLVEPDVSDDVSVVLAYDGGHNGMALAAR